MVSFSHGDHHYAQQRYENAVAMSNVVDQKWRSNMRQQQEDELVNGGKTVVAEEFERLKLAWKEARSNAQFDGLSMAYLVANRANARLTQGAKTVEADEIEWSEDRKTILVHGDFTFNSETLYLMPYRFCCIAAHWIESQGSTHVFKEFKTGW
jgi:uncharacterized protein YndB with AHSA1/START domain